MKPGLIMMPCKETGKIIGPKDKLNTPSEEELCRSHNHHLQIPT
jgi:hypothetical protein